ncbi:MAG: UMP kinase [Bacteroidetes bacterium]|nr:MAG: UMP kinase [Bacteroidota bacterium]
MGLYKRILLKLSGESLSAGTGHGIDAGVLERYVSEINSVHSKGVQVGVVLGGGNIFRGVSGSQKGFDRVQGDYMGMLATVINSLALQSALENAGIKSAVLSGIAIDPLCERVSRHRAIEYLEKGYVVIISGGTGNPFFTTDSAAALRAVEIKADVLLKGTRVDGVYTADPEKDPTATKFSEITFDMAYEKNLKIMDLTAFTLCMENNIPIIVFDINKDGNLKEIIIEGKPNGTIVKNS